jgi:hypothetical protein
VTAGSGRQRHTSIADLRLGCKRSFSRYYLDLSSSGVPTPTEAYEACAAYLAARREELGETLFMLQLDHEVEQLAGEVEQDLRFRRIEGLVEHLAREPVEARMWECVEAGLRR